ncbi:MAG: PIN domain-containing protein [Cyanobacteria bacterium P01_A01_bin.15]
MKTYLDTGVLISAFRVSGVAGQYAMKILDDPSRRFGSSIFVRLEATPKAIYHQNSTEQEFYRVFFDAVTCWADDIESIVANAYRVSSTYGLAAMDALHIAAALSIEAEEFITTEKLTKPMFRVSEIQVISLFS